MAYGDITNVTTGEVRLSFVHLFKPYSYDPSQEEKYSTTILLPKSDTATKARIDAAIEAAKTKGANDKWNGVAPPVVPTPIWDGDGTKQDGTPFGPEAKGHWVFTARCSADRPPEVVDATLNPIINPTEVYSGMYAMVNVEFYAYNAAGKKGIGCSLGPVKKVRDGESLGGGAVSATQAFGGQAPAPQAPAQDPYFAQPQGYAHPQAPAQPAYPQATAQAPGNIDPITGEYFPL